MRQKIGRFLKSVIFIAILLLCAVVLERILVPKYLTDNRWETTSRITGFYQLEKDTVDVLCLGSSRAASSFIPQLLYDDYGIRSYNLGFEQQTMLTSYYWLKEALRYQKPKVVLLHMYFLFDTKRGVLNAYEELVRKSVDWMKWSPNKLEMIRAICSVDPKQDMITYVFPWINYHARWEELSENDYDLSFLFEKSKLMGMEPLRASIGDDTYQPIEVQGDETPAQSVPVMEEYLDKIIELCHNEGIELILYDTPSIYHTKQIHCYEVDYARRKGIRFLDLDEKELYDEIGYVYATDNADVYHANIWGAEKITAAIGNVLHSEYQMQGVEDEQWASTREAYQNAKEDCELSRVTDVKTYMKMLLDKRYSVLIASQGSAQKCGNKEVLDGLHALGLLNEISEIPEGMGYLAVISDGAVEQEMMKAVPQEENKEDDGWEKDNVETAAEEETAEPGALSLRGSLRNNRVMYELYCDPFSNDVNSSIKLDGKEYCMKADGWNIIVYNSARDRVIDRISITETEEGAVFNRKASGY